MLGRQVMGFGFLVYTLTYFLRPDAGLIGYMNETWHIPSWFVIGLFFTCGVLALFMGNPAWRVLLCMPLALIVAAGVGYLLDHPDSALSGVWSYGFVLWLLIAQAYREAKRGD